MKSRACLWLWPLVTLGCAHSGPEPEALASIYRRDSDQVARRAATIIFVPGIEGSVLVDPADGRRYWGTWGQGAPDVERDPGALRKLALPLLSEADPAPHDDLVAGPPLLEAEFGLPIGAARVRGYSGLFEGLLAHLGAPDTTLQGDLALPLERIERGDFPVVEFGYDWRQDVTQQAAGLHRTILAAIERSDDPDRRVDIVAHSMGGLLVRWYLRYGAQPLPADGSLPALTWEGERHVRRALLAATPNGGAVTALSVLLDGEQPTWALPRYPAALLGTFPSVYQLLPHDAGSVVGKASGASLDLYDVGTWERHRWGLFDPGQASVLAALLPDVADPEARLRAAREHLKVALRRARAFHAALDVAASPPASQQLHMFVGDDLATQAVIAVDEATGARTPVRIEPGDGRVTRRSALLDGRPAVGPGKLRATVDWRSVHFVGADHMGIVADGTFLDDALYLLLDAPDPPPTPAPGPG